MDYSAEFSLKFEITLDTIPEMNKEQLFFCKRGLATQMFFLSRSLSRACAFRKDSEERRKQLDLGYQPDYQHICKVTGPLGNVACYFRRGKPEVPQCVFLPLFNFSLQWHSNKLIHRSHWHCRQSNKKIKNHIAIMNISQLHNIAKHLRINVRFHITMCRDHNGGVKGHVCFYKQEMLKYS